MRISWYSSLFVELSRDLQVELTAGVDLAVAKEAIGDRICLIGNIDIPLVW
jgi:hypothetical protein